MKGARAARRAIRVVKFGGSSVGNSTAFEGARKMLLGYRRGGEANVVGVFSAIMGVTDVLLAAGDAHQRGDDDRASELRESLLEMHLRTAEALVPAGSRRSDGTDIGHGLRRRINEIFEEHYDPACDDLRSADLRGGAAEGNSDADSMDRLVACGERLSTNIMASYLRRTGTPAQAFEADADGLIFTQPLQTDGFRPVHVAATNAGVATALQPALDAGLVPCVTGFIAQCHDGGQTTTLGRGGSDLTASLVGSALDAAEVVLSKVESEREPDGGWMAAWKEGWIGIVRHADPKVTIDRLSYREAAELARYGRKVLHRYAVQPLLDKGIPIRIANTLDCDHPGTVITAESKLARLSQITSRFDPGFILARDGNAVSEVMLVESDETTRVVLVGEGVAQNTAVRATAERILRENDVKTHQDKASKKADEAPDGASIELELENASDGRRAVKLLSDAMFSRPGSWLSRRRASSADGANDAGGVDDGGDQDSGPGPQVSFWI